MGKHVAPPRGAVPGRRPPRVALWMSEEEADAFLTLMLHAPTTPQVAGEVADRLLCRVAGVQRELSRTPTGAPRMQIRRRPLTARAIIIRRRSVGGESETGALRPVLAAAA